MDIYEPEKRREIMAKISGKDTFPEVLIRKKLFLEGFRFRVNNARYPGCPDIMLSKYKAAIFVHGCFWHQHKKCPKSKRPATQRDFWNRKLDANVERDRHNVEQLRALGWRVAIVWECAIKKKSMLDETVALLVNWIRSDESEIVIPVCGSKSDGC